MDCPFFFFLSFFLSFFLLKIKRPANVTEHSLGGFPWFENGETLRRNVAKFFWVSRLALDDDVTCSILFCEYGKNNRTITKLIQ